jgi:glutamyl-tRNA reductase
LNARVASKAATVVALSAHARGVPSVAREAFAAAVDALPPAPGMIAIHTCHRVEVFIAPASYHWPLPELPAGGDRREGVEAAAHLIAVACGLDSVVFGEDQVLHQLRETLAARHRSLPLDPVLERLFQSALHAGRVAHTWFSGPPRSLVDVALDEIARTAGSLEGRHILVAGVGRMGRLAAFAVSRRGAIPVVTNRTYERAVALAAETGGIAIPFVEDDVMPPVAGVVIAVAGPWAPGPRDAARLAEQEVTVVDLSSPPAVPADFQARLGKRFLSIDELGDDPEFGPNERLRRRLERLVSDTGRDYCNWLRTREAVPAIQAMTDTAEGFRRSELDSLLRRHPELVPEQQTAIEQMSHRLVAAILHAPLAALREDVTGDRDRAARELFGL